MIADSKGCPFCGETIKAVAIRCRFCNSDITAGRGEGKIAATAAAAPENRSLARLATTGLLLALAVPLLVASWTCAVGGILFCRFTGVSDNWLACLVLASLAVVPVELAIGLGRPRGRRALRSCWLAVLLSVAGLVLNLAVLPDRRREQERVALRWQQVRRVYSDVYWSIFPRTLPTSPPASRVDRPTERPKAQVAQAAPSAPEGPSLRVDVSYPWPWLSGDTLVPAVHHLIGRWPPEAPAPFARVTLSNYGRTAFRAVRVEVQVDGFSSPAVQTTDVMPGATRRIDLTPIFHQSITDVIEARPGAVRITARDQDGRVLADLTHPITVAGRNDLAIGLDEWDPRLAQLYRALFCVFVTPNDPIVDEIVCEAAEFVPGRSIVGYQQVASRGQDSVTEQIAAVYEVLKGLGIKYRSATNLSLDRGFFGQKIYFPVESLDRVGANCADGTVLYAAALEKMCLDPCMVFVPGHVFIGVTVDPKKPNIKLFVETTLIGTGSFEEAVTSATAQFEKNRQQALIVELAAARRLGVRPFPLNLPRRGQSVRERLRERAGR